MDPISLTIVFGLGIVTGLMLHHAAMGKLRAQLDTANDALELSADRAVEATKIAEQVRERKSVSIYVDSRGMSYLPPFAYIDQLDPVPDIVVMPATRNRAVVYLRQDDFNTGEVQWAALGDGLHPEVLFSADGLYLGSRGAVSQPWGAGGMDIARVRDAWEQPPQGSPLSPPQPRAPRVSTENRRLDFNP